MNVALVPVKALAWGKTRLSRLLSEGARHAVSRAMLTDVLTCLQKSSSVDKTVVVSSDATLLALAEAFGALTVDEEQPRGLNGAVSLGTSVSIHQGATALLVLLADLPLVEPSDVDLLFRHTKDMGKGVILTPCKEGDGTNALLRVPPLVMPPCFGGPSLVAHQTRARSENIPCRVVEVPHIAFDMDSVDDLQRFVAHPSDTQTYRVLQDVDAVKSLVQ